MSDADAALDRAETLLARLETARGELEGLATRDDPERAIEVLQELAELAREVEAELQRARRAADA